MCGAAGEEVGCQLRETHLNIYFVCGAAGEGVRCQLPAASAGGEGHGAQALSALPPV